MIGILKLREELHNRCLRSRSVLNVICKITFEVLWNNSTEDKQKEALQLIDKLDKDGLLNWVRTHPSISPAEMNHHQLTTRAKELHILNYSRLSKEELIVAINGVMRNEEG